MSGRGGKRRGRPRYTVLDITKREEELETEPKTEEEQQETVVEKSQTNSLKTEDDISRFEEPDEPEFEKEWFGGEELEERRGRREKSMDYHQFVKVIILLIIPSIISI